MSDIVLDSRASRPADVLDSRATRVFSAMETWLNRFEGALTEPEMTDDGQVSADDVEGLPLRLVKLYAEIAARHAVIREIEPGIWVATVVGLDGAWGDGDTPRVAAESLDEAVVGWVAVKRRVGATDIPPMEGIDLNLRH